MPSVHEGEEELESSGAAVGMQTGAAMLERGRAVPCEVKKTLTMGPSGPSQIFT